jgi:glycosyltransferase involved in cell wall biosynthesis
MAFYKASDALIFPTLGDGFGMVATEAWACGLPVITTDCAGAFDLLKVGQNGLAIPAGDAGGIASTIDWCVANRSAVRDMREGAFDTAESWQWGDYRGALTDALRRQGLFGAEF